MPKPITNIIIKLHTVEQAAAGQAMSNPLARRMVTCGRCFGAGRIRYDAGDGEGNRWETCNSCQGTGAVPEPWQATAERNARIARWLADPWGECEGLRCLDCTLMPSSEECFFARLLKAEKATEVNNEDDE